MDIKYLANACEDYIIEQRRWFHRHPEVAWEEVQTTIAIEDQLRKIGLEPVRYIPAPLGLSPPPPGRPGGCCGAVPLGWTATGPGPGAWPCGRRGRRRASVPGAGRHRGGPSVSGRTVLLGSLRAFQDEVFFGLRDGLRDIAQAVEAESPTRKAPGPRRVSKIPLSQRSPAPPVALPALCRVPMRLF